MYDWIQTFTGKKIYLTDPKPEDIEIVDIVHALSQVCRYGGHCKSFYSVSSHSVNVAQHLPDNIKLQGLLHDASEAYVHDIVRPIKLYLGAHYAELEEKFCRAIFEKFELEYPMDDTTSTLVKHVDTRIMLTERRDLILDQSLDWEVPGEPYPEPIMEFTIPQSKQMFLGMFYSLMGIRQMVS